MFIMSLKGLIKTNEVNLTMKKYLRQREEEFVFDEFVNSAGVKSYSERRNSILFQYERFETFVCETEEVTTGVFGF